MIPLGDSVGGRRQPVVTLALIVACAVVFVYELTLRGAALDQFVERFGAVPRLIVPALVGDPRVPRITLLTLLTSQFVHAGYLHLAGNMLFLWVFGRAVEDRLGSLLYLAFYLLAGTVAVIQCLVSPTDAEPLIGASGAIAGVLGLYFITYPTAWTRVLVPILFFFWTFDLPAVLVLAFWFASQFFSGIAAITHATRATSPDVAVWAHVAGFVFGAIVGLALSLISPPAQKTAQAVLRRENAPGPARLIASVADLAALLLAARLVVSFFGLVAARSPVAPFAGPIVAITQPVLSPLQSFLPTLRVMGGALETYTLVAMLAVYVLAGLLSQAFVRK